MKKEYILPCCEEVAVQITDTVLAVSGGMYGGNGAAGSSLTEDDPFNL